MAGLNPIVIENQKTGNPQSEWDLDGPSSSTIQGFATSISANQGATVSFKINTDSANYRIDIYRLGYYAGLGARLVATLQQNTASVQPAPVGDPAIGLVDAGNWSVTATWPVPSDAVSGVYIAKLVRQDATAGASHIPFIVRGDGVPRDVVFQTSDTTWHAYNGWGGASLYGGNATASPDGRAYKVSYNRPFVTRDGIGTYAGPQDFVFSGEYAAIRWLERNGFDVAYIAGVDTGPGGHPLTDYKVFMSVGHDEYWSGDQRANVEAARDAGVHLIFISGNEVYWKTRWEADAAGAPNRTLVTYKETHAVAKIDPSSQWTGTWRDPSFSPPSDGGRPENALTGTIFQVDSFRADTITVPYGPSLLRPWRNTAVASIQPGQVASLAQGMLGYEWDESPDNGFRPAALVHLSETTLEVDTYLIDYGNTVGSAEATHRLSLYRAPSGALVFGAGTVFWSFGLDTVHDYANDGPVVPTPEDPNVQQFMVNLFADMGVQPQTLQANLVTASPPSDLTPPVCTITAPTAGASLVQQQQVTVSGTAADAAGLVALVEVSTDGGATWQPATGTTAWTFTWQPLLPGSYTILARAVDDSMNVETPGTGVAVTVTPAATVSLFTLRDAPFTYSSDDGNAIELGLRFKATTGGSVSAIRFYKNPNNVGTHVGHLWDAAGTLLGTASFSGETASGWQQASLASPVTLTAGQSYVVSYSSNGFFSADYNYFYSQRSIGSLVAPSGPSAGNGVFVYGPAGNFPTSSFLNSGYWVNVVFNRAGGAGNLPPTASDIGGFETTANTPLAIPATALLAGGSDPNGYSLSVSGVSSPSHGTVAYDAGTLTATFTPATDYVGDASFVYSLSNGHGGTASANAGLVVIPSGQTTVSLFSPSDVPATVTVDDNVAVELGVQFESSVDGQLTGILFYKGPQNTGTHVANLWSSTGTLLASATFSGETASGWQLATLQQAVAISAGSVYVASYHAPAGYYSATAGYFATSHTSGVLTAPATGPAGGNGLYAYGTSSSFPVNSYNATNYWVDVVFVPAGQSTYSLFSLGDVPATVTEDDSNAVELGVKFQSSSDAQVLGIRFYKGPQNTGTHVANLWSSAGTLLASATFTGETASGWQTVTFASPVAISANTVYVASYHTGTGYYSADPGYFATAHASGILLAPDSASAGGNGVYSYGAGGFPTNTFNECNYWVDVIVSDQGTA
ncbi:DUF4082 domain-containing protein [Mesorhizobium sp. PUT5]|uniref:DUF4082 domain-containing protein n=1 Tax=Mesorhizobium sp. PUT5 TaxID=3454629 RepID=UPI003FA4D377